MCTRSSAAPRKGASSIPASISIPGRGAFPIIIMRSWIIAVVSASRSSRSSSSITTPICIPPTRSTASRSASATSRPITTAASPSFWPRRRKKARSTIRCRRRIRRSCWKRCGRLARSTRISATGWARIRPPSRLCKASGRRPGEEPIAGEPIGLHDILTSRLWRACRASCSMISDDHVPAGRRHGQDRRSVRAADPGSHSLRRESRRHPADRQHGVTVAFEDVVAAGPFRRSRPTGACARFRSAS